MGTDFQAKGDPKRWPADTHKPTPAERQTEPVVKPRS